MTTRDHVLLFLTEWLSTHRYAPTVRNIKDGCGLSNTSLAYYHLTGLANAQLVGRVPGGARMLWLTEQGEARVEALRREGACRMSRSISEVLSRLDDLSTWQEGWNGYDALPPDPQAIERARGWICHVEAIIGEQWSPPHITAGSWGEIVFEWWRGDRKLTVYCEPGEVTYLKVWGTDIWNDMSDGRFEHDDDILAVWRWLYT